MVRGHRRRGHYRNGRRVRPTRVRTHYRKGGLNLWRRVESSVDGWQSRRESRIKKRQGSSRVADRVCTQSWQIRVRKNASCGIAPDLWALHPEPCTSRTCRELASAAKSLLRLRRILHLIPANVTADLWARFRPKSFETKLVLNLVKRFPQPTDRALLSTVRCLQALGILCCLNSGRDPSKCKCLWGLAKDLTMTELQGELRAMAKPESWGIGTPS